MSIENLIRQKFGKFKKSRGKKGIDYIVTCPFCRKKDKLYINTDQGIYHCFRCGEAGSTSSLLGHSVTFKTMSSTPTSQPLPIDVTTPGELIKLTMLDGNHPAIEYIHNRNFDPAELEELYGVRYCTQGKLFSGVYNTTNTLIFPLWLDNKLIGWQSRLLFNPDKLTDDECGWMDLRKDEDGDWVKPPKYWTSPGLQKGRIFFNYDWARKGNLVVICEGVFDSMAVGRCAVAALGKGLTTEQTNLLCSYWDMAVILLDPDAEQDITELGYKLSPTIPTIKLKLSGYKDPGEAPRDEIWAQIGEAAYKKGIDILNYRFYI